MTQTELRCTGATCKAVIVWDTLTGDASGKPHPFDRVPCKRCLGKGRIAILQSVLWEIQPVGTTPCVRCKGTGTVLKSHFDSCPDAPSFRKKAR